MLSLSLLALAGILALGALIFVSLPNNKRLVWTDHRTSLMYKTAYWLFMVMFACLAGWLIFAALGL